MVMRLLSKKEINSANNAVRKQEIDEGKKLAKRIDSLRQTLLEEEASLELFRKTMVSTIQTELSSLEDRVETLKSEVVVLEAQRAAALAPLDEAWEMVNFERASIAENVKNTNEALERAEKIEAEAYALKSEQENRLEVAKLCEEEVRIRIDNAIIEESKAKEQEAIAAKTKEGVEQIEREALANIAEEKRKLALREEAVANKEKQVDKDRKDIAKTKRQLADERATLERELSKLK